MQLDKGMLHKITACVCEETQHYIAVTTFLEAIKDIKLSYQIPDKMCFHLVALIITFTGQETDVDGGECLIYTSESC
jgi:hypothetical protein